MNLHFRPACTQDAVIAHELIYASAPDVFDFLFDVRSRSARDFLMACFAEGSGLFGWGNHTILESQGRIVGVAALYDVAAQHRMSIEVGRQILRFFGGLRCWRVFRRLLASSRDVPPIQSDALYLAHLSILPEWRRRGVASRFLTTQIDAARTAGYRLLALDLDAKNAPAEVLYRRLGFRPILRYGGHECARSIRLPVRVRMELLL